MILKLIGCSNTPTVNKIIRSYKINNLYHLTPVRFKSDDLVVRINDVSKKIKPAKHRVYIPRNYLPINPNQQLLGDLRWMLQKDVLDQDMFLIGGPGFRRRNLAMAFLELTEQEVEFIALSRDTTEADLKQRREIVNGSAIYYDQSAVRAAKYGRVLILEGIEKAERNVLPILNNLLENREMHLEDGRFLISAARYDKLLETHSQEELDSWKLVRVNEDFRVIALGLPSPRYLGQPLDPPLRSRFQARHITSPSFQISKMPAIWSSSERPISVRTIWVDGIRHAILTADDPLLDVKSRRRPQTSSSISKNYPTKYSSQDSFRTSDKVGGFIQFHILGDKKELENEAVIKTIRRRSAPPVSHIPNSSSNLLDVPFKNLLKTSKDNTSIEDAKSIDNHTLCSRRISCLSRENSVIDCGFFDKYYDQSDSIIKTTISEDYYDSLSLAEIASNPLSDRVLQWMDISGIVKDYLIKDGDRLEKMSNIRQSTPKRSPRKDSLLNQQSSHMFTTKISLLENPKLNSNFSKRECENVSLDIKKNQIEDMSSEETLSDKSKADDEDKTERILSTSKSWSPFGRPQLHIFMPDLNSGEEDSSSEDSLSNVDSLD